MDTERLNLEKAVIAHYMPNSNAYEFGTENGVTYLRITYICRLLVCATMRR